MRFTDHPVDSNDYKRAKELRRNSSPYENRLWFALRGAVKVKNIKFRRQHPIRPYTVDFACMGAKLIIELDGIMGIAETIVLHAEQLLAKMEGLAQAPRPLP